MNALERYTAAMHAMQSGVKMWLTRQAPHYESQGIVPDSQECSPKHLRVGVNSALCESSALEKLLIDKGIITEEEFLTTVTEMLERDAESYHERLGLPPNVRLG